jgi:hypothetical protein
MIVFAAVLGALASAVVSRENTDQPAPIPEQKANPTDSSPVPEEPEEPVIEPAPQPHHQQIMPSSLWVPF